jgi:hypothetical protein
VVNAAPTGSTRCTTGLVAAGEEDARGDERTSTSVHWMSKRTCCAAPRGGCHQWQTTMWMKAQVKSTKNVPEVTWMTSRARKKTPMPRDRPYVMKRVFWTPCRNRTARSSAVSVM